MEVPLRGVLVQQRSDRVGDLTPASVPDGHVDVHAVELSGPVRGLLEHACGVVGQ